MDTTAIAMRLHKLDSYLRTLRQMQAVPLDEYLSDDNIQTIVERKLQLSIQACMDIASYLIGQLGMTAPDEPHNIFAVLGQEGVISRALSGRMVAMVRFRNILVHDCLEIDGTIVHHNLTEELEDFDQFSKEIIAQFLASDSSSA